MSYSYFNILFESAWTASLVPLGHDPTFFAMRDFGDYDMTLPFIVAVVGATVGQCFNYALGWFLLRYGHRANLMHNIPNYLRTAHFFKRYGIWLLVVCWAPLGKLIPLIAGFTQARLRTVVLLILAGETYHYGQGFFPL